MTESERVADLIHADLLGLLQSARRMHDQTGLAEWDQLAEYIQKSMTKCSPLLDQSTRKLTK